MKASILLLVLSNRLWFTCKVEYMCPVNLICVCGCIYAVVFVCVCVQVCLCVCVC